MPVEVIPHRDVERNDVRPVRVTHAGLDEHLGTGPPPSVTVADQIVAAQSFILHASDALMPFQTGTDPPRRVDAGLAPSSRRAP